MRRGTPVKFKGFVQCSRETRGMIVPTVKYRQVKSRYENCKHILYWPKKNSGLKGLMSGEKEVGEDKEVSTSGMKRGEISGSECEGGYCWGENARINRDRYVYATSYVEDKYRYKYIVGGGRTTTS